jgi:hypothetical protein
MSASSNDFDPIADADYCDEHEWAGYGMCPKCKDRDEALLENEEERHRGN